MAETYRRLSAINPGNAGDVPVAPARDQGFGLGRHGRDARDVETVTAHVERNYNFDYTPHAAETARRARHHEDALHTVCGWVIWVGRWHAQHRALDAHEWRAFSAAKRLLAMADEDADDRRLA